MEPTLLVAQDKTKRAISGGMHMKFVRTNFFITDVERVALQKLALKRNTSIAAVIREFLDKALGCRSAAQCMATRPRRSSRSARSSAFITFQH